MGKYRVLLAAALALGGSGGAVAQEAATPVGPPELRDFSLPGTPPPRQEPEPAPTPPPAQAEEPAPAPTAEPASPPPRETPRAERPRPVPPRPQVSTAPPPPATAPSPSTEAAPESLSEAPAAPIAAPAPPPVQQPAAPVAAAEPPEGGASWLWLVVAALAGLAVVALWKSGVLGRMTRRTEQSSEPDELVLTNVVPPARPGRPAAEPAAVRSPTPAVPDDTQQPRPRIDIVFKPAKAEATEAGTSVHYELIVKNLGAAAAGNVRIEARMFNAGPEQDKEIGAFFAAPLREKLVTRPFEIPARSQAKLTRVVSMDKEQVRVITIQGRRLYIPMVAFNILYERGDGETGQTSKCFVVGREKDTPSEKMGAFRLDLGPRIYRSVGQRQTSLAHIA